jgi:DNA-binding beta-propeller fold protein YncE
VRSAIETHDERMRLLSVPLLVTLVVLAIGGGVAGSATAAPPVAGGLVQLPPPGACFSTVAAGGCSALAGFISGASGLTSTADGRSVYAVGGNGGGAAFDRSPDGALTSLAASPHGTVIAAAPDGTGLAAGESDSGQSLGGVQTYTRDPQTGALGLGAHVVDSCGTNPCATDNGLYNVQGVAYSPDGKSLYAASHSGGGASGGAVTAFARNPSTQAISLIQCVPKVLSAGGVCSTGPAAEGLDGAEGIVVSPDGAFVYVASRFDNAVVGFNRVSAGAGLGKLGVAANCLTAGSTTNACAHAPGLTGAAGLAISPDGRDLYVASFNAGVVVLRRNAVSGVLVFTGCITPVEGNGCSGDAALIAGPRNVAVSPDGRYVYVAGGNGATGYVRSYRRDAASGELTSLNCLSNLGTPLCDTAAGLKNATNVSVSPDSRNVYSTAFQGGNGSGAISAFRIEAAPTCADATVATASGQAVQLPLTCMDAAGDPVTRSIVRGPAHGTLGAVDEAGATVSYVPAAGYSGADAIGFTATDGTNVAPPASVAVAVGAAPAPGPGAGPAPGPGLSPAGPAPKTIALRLAPLARQRTRTAAAGGLRVRATCVPGCTLRLTLKLSAAEAKRLHLGTKALRAATSRTTLRSGRAATVRLKLVRRPKSALRGSSRARFTLSASARAAGFKTATKTLTVTLRR